MLIVCNYAIADVDTCNSCATACKTIYHLSLRPLLQHLREPAAALHCAICRVLHTFVRHRRQSNHWITYDPAGHWAAARHCWTVACKSAARPDDTHRQAARPQTAAHRDATRRTARVQAAAWWTARQTTHQAAGCYG